MTKKSTFRIIINFLKLNQEPIVQLPPQMSILREETQASYNSSFSLRQRAVTDELSTRPTNKVMEKQENTKPMHEA